MVRLTNSQMDGGGRTAAARLRLGVVMVAAGLLLAACNGGEATDDADEADDPDVEVEDDDAADGDGDDGDAAATTGEVPADLVVDVLNEPDSLDPLYRNTPESQVYYRNVYSGLLAWEEDGSLVPDLAVDLPEVSDDRLTYTVELRDDVTFHDGTPMTAEDVVFTFEQVADPENGSVWASGMIFLDSVEQMDDTTVEFQLTQPFTYFDTRLAMVPIVSADEGYAPNDTYGTSANGTGPYQLAAFNQGEAIELERFEDYHGELLPMETITLQLVPENASRISRLTNGDSHIVPNLPADQIALVEDRGHNAATVEDNINRLFFYTSHADDRPTSDAAFRLAIAHAINREQVIDQVFDGAGEPNSTYLAPGTQFRDDELGTSFGATPDLDQAGAYLDEAGGAPDRPLEMVVTNQPDLIDAATVLQANLAELGLEARIEVAEVAAFFPRLVEGDYDLLLFASPVSSAVGFAPDYPYGGLHSTSPSNFNSFEDPQMDELLEEAITVPLEEAEEAWHAVQEHDLETQGQIQIIGTQYSEAWHADLEGYEPSSLLWLNNLDLLAE